MRGFTTEAKVGLFIVIGLALLGYMSYRIGGLGLRREKGYDLIAVFNTAAGLKVDGQVQIAGINVGTIKEINLRYDQAEVNIRVSSRIILPVDSIALIRTQGVLGDKYIEIVPGTVGLPNLKTGDQIARTKSPPDLEHIIGRVGKISEDISEVSGSLSNALGGEENSEEIHRIIVNLARMSQNLARLTSENQANINKMVENLTMFASDIREVTAANKENINAILETFRETSVRMNQTITALQHITEKIARGEGSVGALVNDDTTVEDLNATLASLKDVSEKINQGQGTLGRLINDPTTADQLDEALAGVNEYLAREKAFKVYIDYSGEWLFNEENFKTTFNARIQPNETKYYLVGVTSGTRGEYRRTDKDIWIDGKKTTYREEEWKRDELLFNAQLARRYRDLTLRGGLFENWGGVALDYHLFDDQMKVTFEAASGGFDQRPRLKFGLTYELWDHIYATAGYDDLVAEKDRGGSPFFGLGLTFNDDDFKDLLSNVPLP